MMGIREWFNARPNSTAYILGVVAVVAVVIVIVELRANRHTYPDKLPDAFFTVDDGKTFFVASSSNVPPFDYQGQKAVLAVVFECSGKRFVGWMERFTPESRDAILAGKSNAWLLRFGRELKRPGDSAWVKSGDMAVEDKIQNVVCPDGNGTPVAVNP